MGQSSIRTDRKILYAFIDQALSDAARHLETARWQVSTEERFEAAVDRCLRARDALDEAEEEVAVSSDVVTAKKRNAFGRRIQELHRELWCVTKDLSKKTRLCYDQHRQTRVLRMHFLAYSYETQDKAEAVGG